MKWVGMLSVAAIIVSLFSLLQAHDIGRTGQRAYVTVEPAIVTNLDENRLEARVKVTNSGQTPALLIERQVGLELLPPQTPDQIEALDKLVPEEGIAIISADNSQPITRNADRVTPEQLGKIVETEELRVYVYGHVLFEDIFSRPQRTDFCHFYTGFRTATDGRGIKSYPGFEAKPCPARNRISRDGPFWAFWEYWPF